MVFILGLVLVLMHSVYLSVWMLICNKKKCKFHGDGFNTTRHLTRILPLFLTLEYTTKNLKRGICLGTTYLVKIEIFLL